MALKSRVANLEKSFPSDEDVDVLIVQVKSFYRGGGGFTKKIVLISKGELRTPAETHGGDWSRRDDESADQFRKRLQRDLVLLGAISAARSLDSACLDDRDPQELAREKA